MKLKYAEIALATIFLLTNTYGLLGIADSAWRGYHPLSDFYSEGFAAHGFTFNIFLNYLLPQLLVYLANYASFIWMATGLPDNLIVQRRWGQALGWAVAGFVVAWAMMSLGSYLTKPFDSHQLVHGIYERAGQVTTLYFALLGYQALKQTLLFFTSQGYSTERKWQQGALVFDIAAFVVIWLILLSMGLLLRLRSPALYFVALIIPCFYIIYLLNLYWLIPACFTTNKRRFWLTQLGISFPVNLVLNGFYSAMGTYSPFMFLIVFVIIWGIQLCLAIPLAYFIYRRRAEVNAKLDTLQINLESSKSTLHSLQEQINPHFLFNTLNSLYGLALGEKAEKTSEGIQLLGDMMRFTLHENNREKIALGSEVTYLKNYVTLQNLRMAASPVIKISFDADNVPQDNLRIAPMLLVPFVENAYKYGISFADPSWIIIKITVEAGQLNFIARNSVHAHRPNSLQAQSSGIGIQNVQQRLALLYPNRHTLTIIPSETEFIIVLNINLTSS